jgi:dsRNA-specific ribonuclease
MITTTASGKSKKEAQQRAAQNAMKLLENKGQ